MSLSSHHYFHVTPEITGAIALPIRPGFFGAPTHSHFHSRLKTFFFCKILPTAAFLFLLQDWLHDSSDLYCYFWAYPFLHFSFSVFHFLVVGSKPDQGDQRRPGGQHSMRTYVIWDLHGWVQRDLPATDRSGESLSPDVPAGTGGTKV